MNKEPNKTDEQWLEESKDDPHILKIKQSVLTQLVEIKPVEEIQG